MKKRIDEGVAYRLKLFRNLLGLSQKKLAESIGFSQRAVSHWEKAESDIPTVALKKLKVQLGLNIDWLLTGEGKPLLTTKMKTIKKGNITSDITKEEKELLELIRNLPYDERQMIKKLLKKLKSLS